MSNTLNDILTKVSTIVSQETTVTDTSDEYSLWRSYANMAQNEWAETYEWPSLYTEYNSTSTGLATITLPANFRKMAGYPKITADGSTTYDYEEIDPYKREQYSDTDIYCYRLDGSDGVKSLVINPTTPVSGASIQIRYWRAIASLASPADIAECPNPEYMVQRIIAYIWESREDGRFPQAKAEAEKILAKMVEYEMAKGPSYNMDIQTPEVRNYNFRLGRD